MQKTLLFWEIIYECKKAMHPRDPDHKGILVQRKRGVMGVRNWTSFRKRFHIREKKSCWFWSYLLKIWTNSRPPIPPRTISWSYNYYLIFYSKYERMHIAYRYKIKYKLAFSSNFSESSYRRRLPQYIRPGDSYLYARLFLFVHSLHSLFQKLNPCSISIAQFAQFV